MFNHFGENGAKEKWEVYADVLREIYLEIGKFNKSEATFRDSFDYTKNCENAELEFNNKKETKRN